jgi:plastocyanin
MSLLETLIVVLAVAASCAMPGSAQPVETPALRLVVGSAAADGLTFVPDAIVAPATTLIEVTFRNDSSQAHNLTFQAPLSAATRTIVEAGSSDVATFVTPGPGSYPFACTIHMGMTGTLTVE